MIRQKIWHALFEASVLIKSINGVWETISGFAILFLSNPVSNEGMRHISSGNKNFAGVYVLAHGLINLFLAYNLFKERMWSFGVSLVFFSLSAVYLIYKAVHNPSPILIALIIFDIIFNYLTWHEYQYRKQLMQQKLTQTIASETE